MNFKSILIIFTFIFSFQLSANTFLSEIVKSQKHNDLIRKLNAAEGYKEIRSNILKNRERSEKSLNQIKAMVVAKEFKSKQKKITALEKNLKRSKKLNEILENNYRRKVGRIENRFSQFTMMMASSAIVLFFITVVVVGRYRKKIQAEVGRVVESKNALRRVFSAKNPLFRSLRITSQLNSSINYVVYDKKGDIKFASDGVEDIFGDQFSMRANWPALELAIFNLKEIAGKNVRVSENRKQSYFIVTKKELAKSKLRVCQMIEVPLVEMTAATKSQDNTIGLFDLMEDIFADLSSFKGKDLLDRISIVEVGKIITSQDHMSLRSMITSTFRMIDGLDDTHQKKRYEIVLSHLSDKINIEVYCQDRSLSSNVESHDLRVIAQTIGSDESFQSMCGSFLVKNIKEGTQIKSKITMIFDKSEKNQIEDSTFNMEFNTHA